MNDKHRDILRRHWSLLRKDLEPTKLLPYLVNILDVMDEQEVKVKATREDRIDQLLEILPRRGPKAFDEFVKALQEVQPFLASPLIQEAEMEEIKIELSRARTHSARLREEVQVMRTGLEREQQNHQKTSKELEELRSLHETLIEKSKDDKESIETRIQELEATVKQLIEETARLRNLCDKLDKAKSQTMNEEFAVVVEEKTKRKDASQLLKKYDTAEESNSKPLSSSLQHENSLQKVCAGLDTFVPSCGDYRGVAQHYGFSHHEIESAQRPFKSKSKLLSSLLDCEISLNKVCIALDTSPPRCGDYRAVAQHYGFRYHEIQSVLRTNEGGPSRALIESLAATHPELTVQEFAVVIEEKTKRKDASRLLKKYDAVQE